MTWNESNLIPEQNWHQRHQKIAGLTSPSTKFFHDFGCGKQYTSDFLDSNIVYCGYDKFQYHPNSIIIDLDSFESDSFYSSCQSTDRAFTTLCFEGVLEYLQDPQQTLVNLLDLYENPRQVLVSVHSLHRQSFASKVKTKILRILEPQLVYDKSNVNIQSVSHFLFSRKYIMDEWIVDGETNILSFIFKDLI